VPGEDGNHVPLNQGLIEDLHPINTDPKKESQRYREEEKESSRGC
jgi:hypothetical protein